MNHKLTKFFCMVLVLVFLVAPTTTFANSDQYYIGSIDRLYFYFSTAPLSMTNPRVEDPIPDVWRFGTIYTVPIGTTLTVDYGGYDWRLQMWAVHPEAFVHQENITWDLWQDGEYRYREHGFKRWNRADQNTAYVVFNTPGLFQAQGEKDGSFWVNVVGEAPTRTLRFTIDNTTFTDNGVNNALEAAPFIANDRTMVPLRVISEALGATDLAFNNGVITFNISGVAFSMTVGESLPGNMGIPTIVADRTFVPLAFIVNEMGATARWDGDARAAYIYID